MFYDGDLKTMRFFLTLNIYIYDQEAKENVFILNF